MSGMLNVRECERQATRQRPSQRGGHHMYVKTCASTLALLVLVSAGAETARAQNAGQLTVTASSITPRAPRVGEYYTLSVTVRNDYLVTVFATTQLAEVPNGD